MFFVTFLTGASAVCSVGRALNQDNSCVPCGQMLSGLCFPVAPSFRQFVNNVDAHACATLCTQKSCTQWTWTTKCNGGTGCCSISEGSVEKTNLVSVAKSDNDDCVSWFQCNLDFHKVGPGVSCGVNNMRLASCQACGEQNQCTGNCQVDRSVCKDVVFTVKTKSQCNDGEYQSVDKCEPCAAGCSKCGGPEKCDACVSGFAKDSNGKCAKGCLNFCANHGQCTVVNNLPTCECGADYAGERCTIAVGNWSAWSKCSVSCGGGTHRRTCQSKNANDSFVTCQKGKTQSYEDQACNTQACATALPLPTVTIEEAPVTSLGGISADDVDMDAVITTLIAVGVVLLVISFLYATRRDPDGARKNKKGAPSSGQISKKSSTPAPSKSSRQGGQSASRRPAKGTASSSKVTLPAKSSSKKKPSRR